MILNKKPPKPTMFKGVEKPTMFNDESIYLLRLYIFPIIRAY